MNYIVSGIGPGKSGVGRLMSEIAEITMGPNYKIICRSESMKEFIRKWRLSTKALNIIKTVANKVKRKIGVDYLNNEIAKITNSNVIVIHPQLLGFSNLFKLMDNGNNVFLYIVDNSFFCIKSYNHKKGQLKACFDCLSGNFNNCVSCYPFPAPYDKEENLNYLRKLFEYKNRITFLVQNSQQEFLLKAHFGNVKIRQVGLYTNDMNITIEEKSSVHNKFSYDLVYHAAGIEPKGIGYMLLIAKKLNQKRILIPCEFNDIKDIANVFEFQREDFYNVDFIKQTWESGLKTAVANAKMIICPSLWSAPIESAVIKSMACNGLVGIVDEEYSFCRDLPDNAVVKLPSNNIDDASSLIEYILSDKSRQKAIIQEAHLYIYRYMKRKEIMQNRLMSVFE